MGLVSELRRRNVIRVAIAYAVAAWLLIEITATTFPILKLPDWSVTLVTVLVLIGFPLAIIFAWAYELTPEGIKLEKHVDRSQSITHVTGRKLDYFIIAALVLVLGYFSFDKFVLDPSRDAELVQTTTEAITEQAVKASNAEAPDKSIAVLAFTDMSESQDQGWFADGLTEEIINTLVRTPDLLVSSRTSSFAYKGTQKPIQQIASELGVRHVLEGSVRRASDRIRVTAQLIRAVDGFHVWSEHFDRSAEDVIGIQEDLAINIAKALKTTMDPVALEKMSQAGTRSVEAYEHYLSGLASLAWWEETSNPNLVVDMFDHFEKAREVDPGFAAAHAQSARRWQLAFFTTIRGGNALIDVTFQQAFVKFREAMIAAIENAPDETQRMLYEAILANNELRSAEAVRLLRRVLEKLPNSSEATAELATAAKRSLDTEAYIQALNNLLRLGDIVAIDFYLTYVKNLMPSEQHVASVLEQVKRFPNSKEIIYQAHRALLWAGEFAEAHKLYPRLGETRKLYQLAAARQACSLGKRDEAEQILHSLQQEGRSGPDQWHILVLLGEYEAAERALKAYDSEEVPMRLGSFLSYAQFDPRPFPALMSVLEREGLDWPPPRKIPFACPPNVEK